MTEYDDLNQKQRIAHLAFWYDSEVLNGGHMQYFANRGVAHSDETLLALESIGALLQRGILEKAVEKYNQLGVNWHDIKDVEEYCDKSLEGKYASFDDEYYKCFPEIVELLQVYLRKNMDDFIAFIH